MKIVRPLLPSLILAFLAAGCGDSDEGAKSQSSDSSTPATKDHGAEDDHAHDEVSLGAAMIGSHSVELAQGHGAVTAGKEAHLVVKLPYSDSGATMVRAWIGTEDRMLSYVGKGTYAASHDDYDIHATAPDPLPENTLWWVELELPDGTRLVGSKAPIL